MLEANIPKVAKSFGMEGTYKSRLRYVYRAFVKRGL